MTAVNDISLDVEDGESLVVLGPSGSGKSTLLRVIAGLEYPDEGEVTIGGVPQIDLPPHRRDVAIVFQHFALYPHLSALDNITLGLVHGLKLGKADARSRAHEVAARMDITDLLARRPREMSGGQRQRVALARALARRAGVVLLDEPLSGLDAQLRLGLRAEIAQLFRANGTTSIHVTHDQNDAMAMADRIAVFNHGRIEQLGTPDDLYSRPVSLFVAGFIGSPPMNIITMDVQAGELLHGPFGTIRSSTHHPSVAIAVRPEHLSLTGPAEWSLEAQVTTVEHEGPSKIIHFSAGGYVLRARVAPGVLAEPGTTVRVYCRPQDVHVFDTTTGLRIGTANEVLQIISDSDAVLT